MEHEPEKLPPPEYDIGLPFIEVQFRVTPIIDESNDLVSWVKDPKPIKRYPPKGELLTTSILTQDRQIF